MSPARLAAAICPNITSRPPCMSAMPTGSVCDGLLWVSRSGMRKSL